MKQNAQKHTLAHLHSHEERERKKQQHKQPYK